MELSVFSKDGRKKDDIFLIFNLISRFHNYSVGEENSLIQMKWLHFPGKVLKIS